MSCLLAALAAANPNGSAVNVLLSFCNSGETCRTDKDCDDIFAGKHNCKKLNSVLGTKENFCSSFLNEFPLRLVRCFMIPPANSKKRNDVEGIIYHQPDRGLDEGKVERKKNGKQANWSWLEKIILDFNKCAARSNARAQECSLLVSESLSALGMSGRRSADRRPRKIMC